MNNGESKKLSDLKPEELTDAELEQTAGENLIIHCIGQFEAYQIFCPKCGSDEIIFLDRITANAYKLTLAGDSRRTKTD